MLQVMCKGDGAKLQVICKGDGAMLQVTDIQNTINTNLRRVVQFHIPGDIVEICSTQSNPDCVCYSLNDLQLANN